MAAVTTMRLTKKRAIQASLTTYRPDSFHFTHITRIGLILMGVGSARIWKWCETGGIHRAYPAVEAGQYSRLGQVHPVKSWKSVIVSLHLVFKGDGGEQLVAICLDMRRFVGVIYDLRELFT